MTIRSYSELREIKSFKERYDYLKLAGTVGEKTFGNERWMNQQFYTSTVWRQLRHVVITRDEGCDLGWLEFPLHHGLFVHHMNPMTLEQLADGDVSVMNPEYLITVSHRTHNAIHYGDESQLPRAFTARTPGDTKLW